MISLLFYRLLAPRHRVRQGAPAPTGELRLRKRRAGEPQPLPRLQQQLLCAPERSQGSQQGQCESTTSGTRCAAGIRHRSEGLLTHCSCRELELALLLADQQLGVLVVRRAWTQAVALQRQVSGRHLRQQEDSEGLLCPVSVLVGATKGGDHGWSGGLNDPAATNLSASRSVRGS
jgi:hypothetical protein